MRGAWKLTIFADFCLKIDWDRFCADPTVLGIACLAEPACCPFGNAWMFSHISSQSECILTAGNRWGPTVRNKLCTLTTAHLHLRASIGLASRLAVDYVVRMEHLDTDMPAVISAINQHRRTGVPAVLMPSAFGTANTSPTCVGTKLEAHIHTQLPMRYRNLAADATGLIPIEASYCHAQQFYKSPHVACLPAVSHVYHQDLCLLFGG